MSINTMRSVFKYSRHKAAHRLVMLAIADAANEDGWAWPSLANISEKCGGISERYARKLIRECEESGELMSYPRMGGKYGQRSNMYRVLLKEDGTLIDPRNSSSDPPGTIDPPPPEPEFLPPRNSSSPRSIRRSINDPKDITSNSSSLKREEEELEEISQKEEEEQDDLTQEKELRIDQRYMKELEEHFSSYSNMSLPKRKTKFDRGSAGAKWWRPLWNIYDLLRPDEERLGEVKRTYDEETLQATKRLIEIAVDRLRESEYTINGPISIEGVAGDIVATSGGRNMFTNRMGRKIMYATYET